MRLIDADELIIKLRAAGGINTKDWSYAQGWDKAIEEAIRLTEEAQTALQKARAGK